MKHHKPVTLRDQDVCFFLTKTTTQTARRFWLGTLLCARRVQRVKTHSFSKTSSMIVSKMAPEELPRPRPEDSGRFGVFLCQDKESVPKNKKRRENAGVLQERDMFISLIESTFRI